MAASPSSPRATAPVAAMVISVPTFSRPRRAARRVAGTKVEPPSTRATARATLPASGQSPAPATRPTVRRSPETAATRSAGTWCSRSASGAAFRVRSLSSPQHASPAGSPVHHATASHPLWSAGSTWRVAWSMA
jgi:hypothetical protein